MNRDKLKQSLLCAMSQSNTLVNSTFDLNSYVDKLLSKAVFVEHTVDSEIAGFVAFYANSKVGFISFIYVDSDFRGKGIGNRLLDLCTLYLKKKGYRDCRLEVNRNNLIARKMYEMYGFVQIDETEHVLTMNMKL